MPGFCIFYTETNEKDFDYEKATLVIYGNMFGNHVMITTDILWVILPRLCGPLCVLREMPFI